jgi:hypothetical protein
MTDAKIPDDLKDDYRIWSTGKNVRPTAEEHIALIERIARLEQERDELRAQLADADFDFGGWRAIKTRLKQERDALALKVQRLSAPVNDDAFDLLMRIVGKLHAILPIVDGFIALQAVRSGNANIYNGPSLEQELKEADALIAERKEPKS